ncbi:ArsR/SmtB family transcription factor [Saccharopolyspora spinosporotrichia]
MANDPNGSNADPALRALAHPVRLRMLSLIWSAPRSAAGLARALGISHGLASQHLRKLVDVGLVELDEVRAKRGGRERLYRTVHGTHLSSRPESVALLSEALAVNMRWRSQRCVPGEAVIVDADLWVRPEEWEEFRRDLADLVDRLHARSRPRALRARFRSPPP